MRVAIVGCGLVGQRRADVAARHGDEVVACADLDQDRAALVAGRYGCRWSAQWQDVVSADNVDAVVVATFHNVLAHIAQAALEKGKHVLCEKPLARTAAEAQSILEAARLSGAVLKVGFNHRYHRAVAKAHELLDAGDIGEPMLLRAVYGHGGRSGYEGEWRADPSRAGGGELLDQGVHLIDLARWFLGEFVEVVGMTSTAFWPIVVEDNAWALMRTADGRTASLHSAWTQWKNLFRFEVFGREGYLVAEGLGGSYGLETLTHGVRSADSGPPIERRWAFEGPDDSWGLEWQDFTAAAHGTGEPLGTGHDGYRALRIIDAIYESVRQRAYASVKA